MSAPQTEAQVTRFMTGSAPRRAPQRAAARPRRRPRSPGLSFVAGVVLMLAALLAPVALTSTLVGLTLADDKKFAATIEPIINHPDVHRVIATSVAQAATDAMVEVSPFAAIEQQLRESGASEVAIQAAREAAGFAVDGVESRVRDEVRSFVASPGFTALMRQSLTLVHKTLVSSADDSSDGSVLYLDDDGTVWLRAGIVLAGAADYVATHAPDVADYLPTNIARDVALVSNPALAQVHTAAQSVWMLVVVPIAIVGVLVLVGVLMVRAPMRALGRTLIGAGVMFAGIALAVMLVTVPGDASAAAMARAGLAVATEIVAVPMLIAAGASAAIGVLAVWRGRRA